MTERSRQFVSAFLEVFYRHNFGKKNGGINWDEDYQNMLYTFLNIFGVGIHFRMNGLRGYEMSKQYVRIGKPKELFSVQGDNFVKMRDKKIGSAEMRTGRREKQKRVLN